MLLNEKQITPSTIKNMKTNGFTTITNNLDDITEKNNPVINASKLDFSDERKYMNKLKEAAAKIQTRDVKVFYIDLSAWVNKEVGRIDTLQNPVGIICRYIKSSPADFKKSFAGFRFIFYNNRKASLALDVDKYSATEYTKLISSLEKLTAPAKGAPTPTTVRPLDKSPVKDIDQKQLNKTLATEKKRELVEKIAAATEDAANEDEAWDNLDSDEIMKLVQDIEDLDSENNSVVPRISTVRRERIKKLDTEFYDRKIHNKSVKEIIQAADEVEEIPTKPIKVSSINSEWKDMKLNAFQDCYDVNADILKMLESLSSKTLPVSIVGIDVEDTSTNQDSIDTYHVNMEDSFGKRFTLVFDIPKFRNNRFMKLRGNEKVISGQLALLPCQKTDVDTVQCVSNYSKIFIRRYGMATKTYPGSDKVIKALRKLTDSRVIKVSFGDYSTVCSKYNIPMDYVNIASQIARIDTPTYTYYFDQDVYYRQFGADKTKGIPYAVSKRDGSISYFDFRPNDNDAVMFANKLGDELCAASDKFKEIYKSIKPAVRLNYSQASIMNIRLPLIVMLGYYIGLDKTIQLAKISYNKLRSNESIPPKFKNPSIIRFDKEYLVYETTYTSSMLLNGLASCGTEAYSIDDFNKRATWLDMLDEFGGKIVSDGLDNFADLFMDPITIEVCEHCGIPTDFYSLLIYSNNLLATNGYVKHTDISGNRYRTNEIVAGYFYKVLSKSYSDYYTQIKHGRRVGMTMKRSAVIDEIMQDPTMSDLSILNPLLEIEAANSVSFKGLTGMNNDRAYSLDKRTYDDSMINKVALSTGFAANVGINRQTTIDMDITGKRGYIKDTNPDEMSVTKSLSMTEAVTPFGTSHDDPFRSAMTFVQTAKHSMRTAKSFPLLITNGADEAMPYISSDTFVYRAKETGEVVEIVNNKYMIIHYRNPVSTSEGNKYDNECISLAEEVKKNSDGGFYITITLSTDLKVGDKFKKDDIIAYDKSSYSNKNGEDDNLAYNLGVFAKAAILNTDEGFEDSTSISHWLSEAMATDVCIAVDRDLSKNCNVYNMVRVGQEVQEGEPLMIFQNSFDEKDANALLKSITDTNYVSDLGRIKVKSKYTGVVNDIRIYRTCEFDEMSDSLKQIVGDYERQINATKRLYKKYDIPGINQLPPTQKIPDTGLMKNNPDGVKIVFYIKYNDKMSVGDKVVAQSANKGIVKYIFPEGKEPFSEYRPNEKIHALFAARSFNARMVTSVWTSGLINKVLIELDRQVKDIMGIDYKSIEDME